jgi:hypothetical protein
MVMVITMMMGTSMSTMMMMMMMMGTSMVMTMMGTSMVMTMMMTVVVAVTLILIVVISAGRAITTAIAVTVSSLHILNHYASCYFTLSYLKQKKCHQLKKKLHLPINATKAIK